MVYYEQPVRPCLPLSAPVHYEQTVRPYPGEGTPVHYEQTVRPCPAAARRVHWYTMSKQSGPATGEGGLEVRG